MKTTRWIRIVLGAAILGYLAYDLFTGIVEAHDYYSSHKSVLLALLFVAPLLGIIALVYRDKVTERVRTIHALLATTILAAAITVFTTQLAWTIWSAFELSLVTIQHILLGAVALIMLYGIASGLWWYTSALWKKHRTIGSRVPSTRCRVP